MSMKKMIRRFLLWFTSTLLLLLAAGAVFLYFVYSGPSPHYRDRFVREAVANGTDKLLVSPFLSDEEIASILNETE